MELAQNTAEFDQRYHALGSNLAFVGTTVPVPLAPAAEQPEDGGMRNEIAQNGYEIVQPAPPPYTHLIAVNHHQIEETPLSFFLVELQHEE